MKFLLFLILFCLNSFAQNGKVYENYKIKSLSTNESSGSIFSKPFQEYNYIKTSRGIEVFETYKSESYNTNESKGTIFSKPFPKFIIINDKVYETYNTKTLSTNESKNTIFLKPFESKQILNIEPKSKYIKQKNINTVNLNSHLPKYNGEGDISYGQ